MSSPFTDRAAVEAALDQALRDTSAQTVLFSQAVADRVGISATDLETLDILVRSGPLTAGRIAELTGLTTGAITGLVDRLERRGYVHREPHPTDRRSVIVQPLTETAERDLAPSYAGMSRAMGELMSGYSDEELSVITDFMTRAATITAEQVTRLRSEAKVARSQGS